MTREHYTPLFSSIRHSTKLAALKSHRDRWFYACVLAQCDAWGRIDARPIVLLAECWPIYGETIESTAAARDALVEAGLLELHRDGDGREWLQVPDWEEKAGRIGKRDHRRLSNWPDPSNDTRASPGQSRPTRATPRARASEAEAEAKAEARKGEPEREEAATAAKPRSHESLPEVLARREYEPVRACRPVLAAWERWLEHCAAPRSPARTPSATTAATILNRALACVQGGRPELFAAAVEDSIANSWQGVNPRWVKGPSSSPSAESAAEASRRSVEAMQAKVASGRVGFFDDGPPTQEPRDAEVIHNGRTA